MSEYTKVGEEWVAEEEACIARAKQDLKEFAPLYRRYVDPIYRYCYSRLGDSRAAEDTTSLVFYKAMAGLHKYKGGSFRSWLFTIAHNVIVDSLRRKVVTQNLEAVNLANPLTPEDEVSAEEESLLLRTAIAELTSDQQEVIALKLAGLSGKEIAKALGRSLSSIKMLQFRAIEKLRVSLRDMEIRESKRSGQRGGVEDASK